MDRIHARARRAPAFTLLELLVVIGVLTLLIGILVPALSAARQATRATTCLSNLHQMGKAMMMYADEFDDVLPPMRMFKADGGTGNKANFYDVGNGVKYRPRWAAVMGRQLGIFAFDKPDDSCYPGNSPNHSPSPCDRQNYEPDIYFCPEADEWKDERNHGYGYNYQFLGNSRAANGQFYHFPVYRSRLSAAGTVVVMDALGTAAGYPTKERVDYSDDGTEENALGNHGYNVDPPRLLATSDHGTGDPGSRRSAVDPRHGDRVNVVFLDGHGDAMTDDAMGYRKHEDGRYVDLDPYDPDNAPHNRLFSGTGRDLDPPLKPAE